MNTYSTTTILLLLLVVGGGVRSAKVDPFIFFENFDGDSTGTSVRANGMITPSTCGAMQGEFVHTHNTVGAPTTYDMSTGYPNGRFFYVEGSEAFGNLRLNFDSASNFGDLGDCTSTAPSASEDVLQFSVQNGGTEIALDSIDISGELEWTSNVYTTSDSDRYGIFGLYQQDHPGGTVIGLDNIELTCETGPCPQGTTLLDASDSNTGPGTKTYGSYSTECTASSALNFRDNSLFDVYREVEFSVDASKGGLLEYDIFLEDATSPSCDAGSSGDAAACTDYNACEPHAWFNEVRMRGIGINDVAPGMEQSDIEGISCSAADVTVERGFEIAGPVGLSLTNYVVVVAYFDVTDTIAGNSTPTIVRDWTLSGSLAEDTHASPVGPSGFEYNVPRSSRLGYYGEGYCFNPSGNDADTSPAADISEFRCVAPYELSNNDPAAANEDHRGNRCDMFLFTPGKTQLLDHIYWTDATDKLDDPTADGFFFLNGDPKDAAWAVIDPGGACTNCNDSTDSAHHPSKATAGEIPWNGQADISSAPDSANGEGASSGLIQKEPQGGGCPVARGRCRDDWEWSGLVRPGFATGSSGGNDDKGYNYVLDSYIDSFDDQQYPNVAIPDLSNCDASDDLAQVVGCDPVGNCCGVTSGSEILVQVEVSAGVWSTVRKYSNGFNGGAFATNERVMLPPRARSATQKIRFRQELTPGSALTSLNIEKEVWAVNNVAVTNAKPTAASTGYYLSFGEGEFLTLDVPGFGSIGSGDFTIEMWIRIPNTGQPSSDSDILKWNNNGNFRIQIDSSTQRDIEFRWDSAVSGVTDTNNAIPSNTWTYVMLKRDTAANEMRVCHSDGSTTNPDARCGTTTLRTTSISSNNFLVGNIESAGLTDLHIAEIRFWKTALDHTAPRAWGQRIDADLVAAYPSQYADLLAYYPFDEGSCGGVSTFDDSAYGSLQAGSDPTEVCWGPVVLNDLFDQVVILTNGVAPHAFRLLSSDAWEDEASLIFTITANVNPSNGGIYPPHPTNPGQPDLTSEITGNNQVVSSPVLYYISDTGTVDDVLKFDVEDGHSQSSGTSQIHFLALSSTSRPAPPQAADGRFGFTAAERSGGSKIVAVEPTATDPFITITGASPATIASAPWDVTKTLAGGDQLVTFTYTTREDSAGATFGMISPPGTVTLYLTTPEAVDANLGTQANEDSMWFTRASVTTGDYIPPYDGASITAVGPASDGTVSLDTADRIKYVPSSTGASGVITFPYTLTNPVTAEFDSATVSFTLTAPVVTAPTATAAVELVTEDTGRIITLAATPADAENLFRIETLPALATLFQVEAGVKVGPPLTGATILVEDDVWYEPNANNENADSFTFSASSRDSTFGTAATLSVTIVAVDDPPVAIDFTETATENVPHLFTFARSAMDVDSAVNTLSIRIESIPSAAVAVIRDSFGATDITPGNIPYTLTAPNTDILFTATPPDVFGLAYTSWTYSVRDATSGFIGTGTITMDILPSSTAPVALAQSVSVTEDISKTIILTATDKDDPKSALSFKIASLPSKGNLFDTIAGSNTPISSTPLAVNDVLTNANGEVIFTPNLDQNGGDSFTFTVTDSDNPESAAATVTITIAAVQDPPVANDVAESTPEGTDINPVNFDATDPDGETLFYRISGIPTIQGTVKYLNGTTYPNISPVDTTESGFIYTPAPYFFGVEVLDYSAGDGIALSSPAMITITVTFVNDAPVPQPGNWLGTEDSNIVITLTSTDPDPGDTALYFITALPSNGQLWTTNDGTTLETQLTATRPGSVVDGTIDDVVIYRPNDNFNGADFFEFCVEDSGPLTCVSSARIDISLSPVNDAPTAVNDTVSQDEDTDVLYLLSDRVTDIDTNAVTGLTYVILGGLPPSTTGTLRDGSAAGPIISGLGAITTDRVNFKPFSHLASNPAATPLMDLKWRARDTGNNLLVGNDVFLHVIVDNINDRPTATSFTVNVNEGSGDVTITLNGADVDIPYGDSVSWVITGLASDGELRRTTTSSEITAAPTTLPNNMVRYRPDPAFVGVDTFQYIVRDADGPLDSTPPTTVTVNVGQVNDPPTGVDVEATGNEEAEIVVTLDGWDIDTDNTTLTFFVQSLPSNGIISTTTGGSPITFPLLPQAISTVGSVFYTGFTNFAGDDTFTFVVNDGESSSAPPSTATVHVNNTPDRPIADDQVVIGVLEAQFFLITLTGSDPDTGDSLTFTLGSDVSFGLLSENSDGSSPYSTPGQVITGATLYYTSNAQFAGVDTFTFFVTDDSSSTLTSAEAGVVQIVVEAVNDRPTVNAVGPFAVAESGSQLISLTGSDPDGDTIEFVIQSIPSLGDLYSWEQVQTNPSSFQYVRIESGFLPLTLDNSNMVRWVAGTTPGNTDFQFIATDGVLNSNPATTVDLTVTAVADAPVAFSQTARVFEDSVDNLITLVGNDPEGTDLTYTITRSPYNGTLTQPFADDRFHYTPNPHFFGLDSFVFTVTDEEPTTSAPATVTLLVDPRNDLPFAADLHIFLNETVDTSDWALIVLNGNETVDAASKRRVTRMPGTFDWEITTLPTRGNLTQGNLTVPDPQNQIQVPGTTVSSADGAVWYLVPPGDSGEGYTAFEYIVVDYLGGPSQTATVTIDVEGVNIPPEAPELKVQTDEDVPVMLVLKPTDANNNPLTVFVRAQPVDGQIHQADRISGCTDNVESCFTIGTQIPGADNGAINDPLNPACDCEISQDTVSGDWFVWFVPNLHFSGQGIWEYQAKDQVERSSTDTVDGKSPGRVTIFVQEVNFAPQCNDTTFTILENTGNPATGTTDDTGRVIDFGDYVVDPDDDFLRYAITSPPNHGTLYRADDTEYLQEQGELLINETLRYAPDLYYSESSDLIEWQPRDGGVSFPTCAIRIEITPVNNPPIVFFTRVSLRESRNRTVTLTGNDPDGDTDITFIITKVRCPATPNRGFVFQRDGTPIQSDNTDVTDTETNQVIYRPLAKQTGKPWDCFLYAARDSNGAVGESADVVIDVLVNTPPIAAPDDVFGFEDQDLLIRVNGTDANNDPLTGEISFLPLFGRLYHAVRDNVTNEWTRGPEIQEPEPLIDPDRHVFFVPARNEFSQETSGREDPYDEFGFRVFDGDDLSRQDAKIRVFITRVQDTPISRNITLNNAQEDEAITIILSGTSPDGTEITRNLKAEILTLPENGELSQNAATTGGGGGTAKVAGGTRSHTAEHIDEVPTVVTDPDGRRKVLYQPRQDWSGVDSFSFRIFDDSQASPVYSLPSWVVIDVKSVNDKPVANNQTVDIVPGTAQVVSLNGTDVDVDSSGDQTTLIYTITTLPDDVVLYQVDAGVSGGNTVKRAEEIFSAPTDVTDEQGRVEVDSRIGLSTLLVGYRCRDPSGAQSDEGFLEVRASAAPSSGGGGSSIGLIAGVVGGAGGALCCLFLIFLWWRRKVAQSRISVYDQMGNRKASRDLLEKLILHSRDTAYPVVCALSDITSEDALANALVTIFVANDQIMPLIKVLIQKEVRECKNTATLFRGNSIATKTITMYSKLIGVEYLQKTLGEPVNAVMATEGSFEVDPRKLQEGENLEENWERLLGMTNLFFDNILNSGDNTPREFREICQFLHEEVSNAFPDFLNVLSIVGGFLFLRFLCPAINMPAKFKLTESNPPQAKFRCLVLVAKALQNLSNGVTFGSKEKYMSQMNDFIVKNLHTMKSFLASIREIPEANEGSIVEIDSASKVSAVETVHRYLYRHQEELITSLSDVGTDENSREYLEHLAALDLVLTYSEQNTEEITEVLVSDMPMVFAVASAVPTSGEEVSRSLITVFEAHGMTVNLLRELVETEIGEARNQNMLLRGNSTALRMIKAYVDQIGVAYLQQVLGTVVKLVVNDPRDFEVHPDRVSDVSELERNTAHLIETAQEFIRNVFQNVDGFPVQIRVLCQAIYSKVEESTFSDSRLVVLGDFVFSRIICPAIITPMNFGIIEEMPSPDARRALLLITKTIQLLAHNTGHTKVFTGKEEYMSIVQPFVQRNLDPMIEYLQKLVDISPNAADDAQLFRIDAAQLSGAVRNVHAHIQANEEPIRQILTPDLRETGDIVDRLRHVLDDLGPPVSANPAGGIQ